MTRESRYSILLNMKFKNVIALITLMYMTKCSLSAPVDSKKPSSADSFEGFNLEYENYMKEIVKLLENDEDFIHEIKNSVNTSKYQSVEDISYALQFAKHNVRTKLDELKRIEMDRIRRYAVRQMEHDDPAQRKAFQIPTHIDLNNPHSFEANDLTKLIQTAQKDMHEISRKRKEEFKRYEMEKEHNYRENLRKLNETERKLEEKKHEELVNKHKDHPKVHEPGSKSQLQEVWEEEDDLPAEEFNPETFFSLRDLNGDQHLDEEEIQAFLTHEIQKLYNNNNEEDDPVERQEELARMAEYIFREADTNNDYLISKEEFLNMTKRRGFDKDEGWKGLDEELPYTEEELEEYEKMLEKKKKEALENKI